MNIKEIIKTAKKFRKKTGGTLTFEKARDYIKAKGYTVILFDDKTDEIYSYGLIEILADKEAYTYLQNVKLIFIRITLDAETKLKRLLHEIGHIELGHLYNEVLTVEAKEYEAETFTYYAMQPPSGSLSSKIAIILLSVCLAASVAGNIIQHIQNTVQSKITPQTEALQQTDTNYYVTKTGTKYHTQNCRYASTGEAVTEEYAKSHYEPCNVCNPK